MGKNKRNIEQGEPYLDLYMAIFQQAVKDDVRVVCGLLREEMKKRHYEQSDVRQFFKDRLPEIERKISKNVYAEAQEWPKRGSEEKDLKLIELYNEEKEYLKGEVEKMKTQITKPECESCCQWEDKTEKHIAQCAVFKEIWQKGECPAYIHKQNIPEILKLEEAIRNYGKKQKET